MKVYINIKNDSGLHPHQPFNKKIWLMKRERKHTAIHHFSFGDPFDEALLNTYQYGCQNVTSLIHQFIGFSPLDKSAGDVTGVVTAIRRLAGRTSGLYAGKGKSMSRRKEKGNRLPLIPPQAFGEQKAIAH